MQHHSENRITEKITATVQREQTKEIQIVKHEQKEKTWVQYKVHIVPGGETDVVGNLLYICKVRWRHCFKLHIL